MHRKFLFPSPANNTLLMINKGMHRSNLLTVASRKHCIISRPIDDAREYRRFVSIKRKHGCAGDAVARKMKKRRLNICWMFVTFYGTLSKHVFFPRKRLPKLAIQQSFLLYALDLANGWDRTGGGGGGGAATWRGDEKTEGRKNSVSRVPRASCSNGYNSQ